MGKILRLGLAGILGAVGAPGLSFAGGDSRIDKPVITGPSTPSIGKSTPKLGGAIGTTQVVKPQPGAPPAAAATHEAVPGAPSAPGAPGTQAAQGGVGDSAGQAARTAVTEINKEEAQEAEGQGGGEFSAKSVIDKVFDGALSRHGFQVRMPEADRSGVIGKVQGVREQVNRKLEQADGAEPPEAPSNYQAVIRYAEQAFKQGLLTYQEVKKIEGAVRGDARSKAQGMLTRLVAKAYESAAKTGADVAESERQVKRALGGIDAWQGWLGRVGRPFIEKGEALKSDIQWVQKEVRQTSSHVSIPRISFERKGDSLVVKGLPVRPLSKAWAEALALTKEKASQTITLEEDLDIEHRADVEKRRDPWGFRDFRRIYEANRYRDINKKEISHSGPVSFYRAARYWVGLMFKRAWHWVRDRVARLLGKQTAVSAGQDGASLPQAHDIIPALEGTEAAKLLEELSTRLKKNPEGLRAMGRLMPAAGYPGLIEIGRINSLDGPLLVEDGYRPLQGKGALEIDVLEDMSTRRVKFGRAAITVEGKAPQELTPSQFSALTLQR